MEKIQDFEIFALLKCYAALVGCSETSVTNYQHTLRNMRAERRSLYTPAGAWNHAFRTLFKTPVMRFVTLSNPVPIITHNFFKLSLNIIIRATYFPLK
jgi:hypothetical protein